ncbi:UDP-N-acetylglucosamine 1-carboxyvinyltransferase [Patescibacteria group bacterium]|nr:UDP-N-acetylglucosamine 1-carboxyvinyltransferase [Patescibacteria group bacterium]MBU4512454.1 UDP-N-acetylglucosamine 1-carboxyvinyltransferase [Patescibacteria group bacterium]MCG2692582.1 UDP-N-acetylglucosamine 1-carboxyvinyltransferase [Candidatus Parcubacteria bacterium]
MSKFIITGGKKLSGEIPVNGAKNAALKIIPAALLFDEKITISNVPKIEDVTRLLEIVKDLGVEVKQKGNTVKIQAGDIKSGELSRDLVPKLRASNMLIGPLLLRVGEVVIPHAGGCAISRRPIDVWVNLFKQLGAEVEQGPKLYTFKARKMRGAKLVFPFISVTATEALMMTAVLLSGKTTIVNAAMEPEIPALADYLNECGAKIKGAGTSEIVIEGVKQLKARPFTVIPDRIEAGSFACLGAATRSRIKITHCNPNHLEVPLAILEQMGVNFVVGKDYIQIKEVSDLKATKIKTHEYPGFPTDLQSPFTTLLTQAKGDSLVHETIFEGRLFYTDILNQMGAEIIMCDPHRVIVQGPTKLYGTKVASPDIRAGIALIIAGLIAEGETEIDNIYQIDRGYEDIEGRLKKLGAGIKRLE